MARAKASSSTTTSPPPDAPALDNGTGAAAEGYTVVARRYRPQRFEDVVGQDHVVQALRNAIRMNRVTHAYLFAGTRGVGKTSIARIFAKCLNCVNGPTDQPCLKCDICQAIATGDDIDVIEIDGASNNGVESVRELRQNTGLRPSRARYKIYYIDEVHMLSTGAFNALLKTLEEPPEHVKFLFATTEPNKIPVTVLSRCQRYDFAGITPEQIVETLAEICTKEGIEAEPDALRTIARRAGGSMRDAQSLLEQLLATGGERLTVELVHRMLGTASDERVLDLIEALADRQPALALQQLDQAAGEGVQPTDLLNGVLEYLRDVMVLSTGAETILMAASPRQRERLQKVIDRWPLDAILASLQILAEARARLRGSAQGRLVVELALVRVARLENLSELSELVGRLSALESGAAPAPGAGTSPVKKKLEPTDRPAEAAPAPPAAPAVPRPRATPAATATPAPSAPAASRARERDREGRTVAENAPPPPLEIDVVHQIWPEMIKKVGVRLGVPLTRIAVTAISGPSTLVIALPAGYNWVADECDTPDARAKIEQALARLLHRPVTIRFERSEAAEGDGPASSVSASSAPRRADELAGDPMIQRVIELFEARPLHLEYDDEGPGPAPE